MAASDELLNAHDPGDSQAAEDYFAAAVAPVAGDWLMEPEGRALVIDSMERTGIVPEPVIGGNCTIHQWKNHHVQRT